MTRILTELHRDGPTEDEVQLAAARLQGRELMRRLSAIGRAYFAGSDLWREGRAGGSRERIEALGGLKRTDVAQACKWYFDPARAAIVAVR